MDDISNTNYLNKKYNNLNTDEIDKKNPSSLNFLVTKLNGDMNTTLQNYENKIQILERTLQSLQSLYNKSIELRKNNREKIEIEFEKALSEISNRIEEHKNIMTNKIDENFLQVQNNIITAINNKKQIKEGVLQQIQKLREIALNEVPRLYENSAMLSSKNKENIENIHKILNEEIITMVQEIKNNENKLVENQENFNNELNNQTKNIVQCINEVKNCRIQYEETMFNQLNDFIDKMKSAIG